MAESTQHKLDRVRPPRVQITYDVEIGGAEIIVMAGPCSVEGETQLLTTAEAVAKAGARILRGGAFKPRTSPYEFQGLGEKGLKLLSKARKRTGLKIVTELLSEDHVDLVAEHADILQIGARQVMPHQKVKAHARQADEPLILRARCGINAHCFAL